MNKRKYKKIEEQKMPEIPKLWAFFMVLVYTAGFIAFLALINQ